MKLPKFYTHSSVPIYLSWIAPIEIWAITLGPFVFSRGRVSERTRNHETIHWEQYKELAIVPFLILYGFYWLLGMWKYRDGEKAYLRIPFEQEAYEHEEDFTYLDDREKYSWTKYKV